MTVTGIVCHHHHLSPLKPELPGDQRTLHHATVPTPFLLSSAGPLPAALSASTRPPSPGADPPSPRRRPSLPGLWAAWQRSRAPARRPSSAGPCSARRRRLRARRPAGSIRLRTAITYIVAAGGLKRTSDLPIKNRTAHPSAAAIFHHRPTGALEQVTLTHGTVNQGDDPAVDATTTACCAASGSC
jgi:hypothetical protein